MFPRSAVPAVSLPELKAGSRPAARCKISALLERAAEFVSLIAAYITRSYRYHPISVLSEDFDVAILTRKDNTVSIGNKHGGMTEGGVSPRGDEAVALLKGFPLEAPVQIFVDYSNRAPGGPGRLTVPAVLASRIGFVAARSSVTRNKDL